MGAEACSLIFWTFGFDLYIFKRLIAPSVRKWVPPPSLTRFVPFGVVLPTCPEAFDFLNAEPALRAPWPFLVPRLSCCRFLLPAACFSALVFPIPAELKEGPSREPEI